MIPNGIGEPLSVITSSNNISPNSPIFPPFSSDHSPKRHISTCSAQKTTGIPKMGHESKKQAEKAQNLIRTRLCNPNFIFMPLTDSPDTNYSKLKFIISSSITEGCNNSILLLGPRGSGKVAVLELVLNDVFQEYPDSISVIRLNGLLHCDENCAFKASFDDNSQFMIAMLRECGLAHKTIIFVLDEFDLFAQGKQRLLYSLLDAMQSVSSQAVVVGVSCRLAFFPFYDVNKFASWETDVTINQLNFVQCASDLMR